MINIHQGIGEVRILGQQDGVDLRCQLIRCFAFELWPENGDVILNIASFGLRFELLTVRADHVDPLMHPCATTRLVQLFSTLDGACEVPDGFLDLLLAGLQVQVFLHLCARLRLFEVCTGHSTSATPKHKSLTMEYKIRAS